MGGLLNLSMSTLCQLALEKRKKSALSLIKWALTNQLSALTNLSLTVKNLVKKGLSKRLHLFLYQLKNQVHMKNLVLVFVGALLLGSCGSEENGTTEDSTDSVTETQPTSSGDVVKDQIVELISDSQQGMTPLSPIADISNYDSNTEPYLVGENETGNFSSKWDNGDFEGSRFYSKKYDDDSQLGEVRMQILVKEDVYYNYDTDEEDESKKIDFDKYVNIITEEIGVSGEEDEYSEGGYVWTTPTAEWSLSTYDDYSLEFKMKYIR